MLNEFILFWKNAFNYSGRTRRREYWIPNLWNCVIMYILMGIGFAAMFQCVNFATGDFDFRPVPAIIGGICLLLVTVFSIAVFVAQIAASVRRCHDIGCPGYVYALCLLGSLFAVGGVVWLVICFIDSKPEENQWGPNPKVAEPNKYPTSGSIVAAIVAFVVSIILYFILIFGSMIPAMLSAGPSIQNRPIDRVGDTDISTDIDDDIPEIDTEDFTTQSEDITEDFTDDTAGDITEDITTEAATTDSEGGKYYEPNAYTDKYLIKVGNMNLNLDFDGGCTVYDYDGSVRVYRDFGNDLYCDLTFEDSYVSVGSKDDLVSYTASNEPLDGFKIDNYEEKKAMDASGDVIVTYVCYKSESDNTVLIQGDIWQNIGADQYMQISFMSNATDNIQAIVDASIVSLN